jgi:site-specific DNA-adenine methylase
MDVLITTPVDETIIYLDPPYFGKRTYEKKLNHDELMEFIKSSPYKIYISSYEFCLPCVFEINKRCTLGSTSNSKKVVEKLFCNKIELKKGSLF